MIDLNQVLTFTEASEKWGLASGNTLRQAVAREKFAPHEIRKSGTVWLTTYDAMLRVFGPLPTTQLLTIKYDQVVQALHNQANWHQLLEDAQQALSNGKKIQITETFLGKDRVLYLFSTLSEFRHWLTLIQHTLLPRNDT